MRVAYILTTFPSRTESFAAREIEALRKLGFDIMVFAAAGEPCDKVRRETKKIFYRPSLCSTDAALSIGYIFLRYPLALGKLICLILKLVPLCPQEAKSLMGNLHTIGFFARHVDREAICHIHAYFLSWPACIGLALSITTGRPFSISGHARDIFVEHGAAELKVSHAKFITTCTRQGLKHLKANLPEKYHHKLRLIYHGISRPFGSLYLLEKIGTEPESNDVVIAVGRLIRKKGFTDLMRAFALIVREKPHCRLMIVGDGPIRRQLQGLIEQLALEDHIQLLGLQEPDMTRRLIEQATLLAVPSVVSDDGDRDGIPNVILEAFASGVPVVASNLEGVGEAVKHHQTGLLVRPGHVKELASTLIELLNNKDLQCQLSRKAYKMIKQRFDAEKNAKQLGRLFIGTDRCARKP